MLGNLDPRTIEQAMASLKAEAAVALREEGYGEDRISHEFELDMRYRGQDSEIQVALGDGAIDAAGLRDRFLAVYRATYGYVSSDEVEIVNLRPLRPRRPAPARFASIATAAGSTRR
jgi:N-methylhydantoinase A